MSQDPAFLTVDEYAALMRVPRSTAYEAIARGTVPGVTKVGRHIRIYRPAVIASVTGDSRVSRPRKT